MTEPVSLWRRFSPFGPWLLLAAVAILCRHAQAPADNPAGQTDEPAKKRVKIIPRREGDVTHFSVENLELTEVTVSFNFDLTNLKCPVAFPYTATFPPQQTTAAFSLTPVQPGSPSSYSFTNHYILGSSSAVHDDSYLYSLPYAPGSAFWVSQGYAGKFSHQGSNRHAIDWRMPVGTPVHAAREGLVVKVKDTSNRRGADPKFDRFNNYVLIRHDDGTLGQYCHLKNGGVNVREGERIREGDLVALSGNTGFSSGPHLHFSVYRVRNGKERESIPVRFNTAEAGAITLKAGKRYTAAQATPRWESRNASRSSSAASPGA